MRSCLSVFNNGKHLRHLSEFAFAAGAHPTAALNLLAHVLSFQQLLHNRNAKECSAIVNSSLFLRASLPKQLNHLRVYAFAAGFCHLHLLSVCWQMRMLLLLLSLMASLLLLLLLAKSKKGERKKKTETR